MQGSEKRYAQALFSAAETAGALTPMAAHTQEMANVLAAADGVQAFLNNPLIPATDKTATLNKAFTNLKSTAAVTTLTEQFIKVLAQNGRLNLLPAILAAFKGLVDVTEGRVTAHVATAEPLNKEQRQDIEKLVLKQHPEAKSVILDESVDAHLVSGLKIRVGSTEIDATARGRLNTIRQNLGVN